MRLLESETRIWPVRLVVTSVCSLADWTTTTTTTTTTTAKHNNNNNNDTSNIDNNNNNHTIIMIMLIARMRASRPAGQKTERR